MPRSAKKHTTSVTSIEIRRDSLAMVRMEMPDEEGGRRIRTNLTPWRNESRSLSTELGIRELNAAMKALVVKEKLSGSRVALTLTGNYCVTRTVTGDIEAVRREVAMIEERSERYLSLGTGPKSVSTSLCELDARHQLAVLAIANSKTLDAVLRLATDTGLDVTLVEPSLVALCRLLGHTGRDTDEPVLIIGVSESGAEVGISHRGQLLLDYQLGNRATPDDVADVVMRHLGRLRRYCDRYYGYAKGRLSRVFICGATASVDLAISKFRKHGELSVEVLKPTSVDSRWEFGDSETDPVLCAALGTCLQSCASHDSPPGPNLAERVTAQQSRPLPLEICRSLWPVAAAAVVAFGLFLANWKEQSECARIAREIERLDPAAVELWRLNYETAEARTRIEILKALSDAKDDTDWNTMLASLARCMPRDLWLDKVSIAQSGEVTLAGSSLREGSIYNFVADLEPAPGWSQVAIQGTWPASGKSGPMTKFDVQCEFDAPASPGQEGNL